jgi:hypothetical protein
MWADHAFESALGGDGWYTQCRNAGSTESLLSIGGAPTTSNYGGGSAMSGGQLSAGALALLIVVYAFLAYSLRRHVV